MAWSVRVGTVAALLWMSGALPAWALHDEGPRLPAAGEAPGGRAAPAAAAALPIAPPPSPVVSREVAVDTLPGGAVPWASLMAPPALGALMQGGGSAGGPTFEYYALDALGSVRVVFDAAGAVTARADYEPFGSPITASTAGPLPREQFTGQQRDGEVGLDYFGARFYHATHGRMLSVDPLYVGAVAEPQRWNRYAHVLNNPLTYVDPDGRFITCYEAVAGVVRCNDSTSTSKAGGDGGVGGASGGGATSSPGGNRSASSDDCQARTCGGGSGGGRPAVGRQPGPSAADLIHDSLDVLGVAIPGIGDLADLASAALYIAEGDLTNAAIAALSAVPVVGVAATVTKWGRRAEGTINIGGGIVDAGDALRYGSEWLGPGYREISPGVFRSQDGLRQFRIKDVDIGAKSPHVHFESVAPDGRTIRENSHVNITERKRP